MLLNRFDGDFLPVENTRGQGGFHISLSKDFTEVFDLSGTGRGNDRDCDVLPDVVDQLDIKAGVGVNNFL